MQIVFDFVAKDIPRIRKELLKGVTHEIKFNNVCQVRYTETSQERDAFSFALLSASHSSAPLMSTSTSSSDEESERDESSDAAVADLEARSLELARKVLSIKLGRDWDTRTSVSAEDVERVLLAAEEDATTQRKDETLRGFFSTWNSLESIVCCTGCMSLFDSSDSEAGKRCDECHALFCLDCMEDHWPSEEDEDAENATSGWVSPTCKECFEREKKEAQEEEQEMQNRKRRATQSEKRSSQHKVPSLGTRKGTSTLK